MTSVDIVIVSNGTSVYVSCNAVKIGVERFLRMQKVGVSNK